MKKVIGSFMMFLLLVCGCSAQKETTPDKKESKKAEVKEEVKEKNEEMKPEEKTESNRIRLKVGDILVYAPWGNLSIFYHEYNYTDDLLAIGHIDEGLDILTSQTEDFKVTIELSE